MATGNLKGKTALITGGTRGIGRAVADRLASGGCSVALNYFSRTDDADRSVHEIKSSGGRAIAIAADVSRPDEARACVARTQEVFGPPDILVHCAAVAIHAPASEITWEIWRKNMDVNLDGTFNMVYAVKDGMIERRSGCIVTFASVAALRPREHQVAYSASKAGVIALTRCCAEAWGPSTSG